MNKSKGTRSEQDTLTKGQTKETSTPLTEGQTRGNVVKTVGTVQKTETASPPPAVVKKEK